MTTSENYGTPGVTDEHVLSTAASRAQEAAARGETPLDVLGVLTGQVPVKSMPIAGTPLANGGYDGDEHEHHECGTDC